MKTIGEITKSGEIIREFYREGHIFKDFDAFKKKKGVCYVAELSDDRYTYKDFLEIAKNNPDIAEELFDACTWTAPSTIYEQWRDYGEVEECMNCGKAYLTDEGVVEECPFCRRDLRNITN